MAVHSIGWEGSDTDQKWSNSIWGKFPVAAIKEGVVNGYLIEDYFTSFNKTPATTEGNWSAGMGYAQFSSTGATITPAADGSGIVLASDDDNEGASIRTLATPFKLIQGCGAFCFEAAVALSTVANTTFEAFVGLMENAALTATVPITATAATLADQNLVGFYRTESDGDAIATTYKANGVTAVTVAAAEIVPVAATTLKLGMKLVPSGDKAGAWALSFYKDGVRCSTAKLLPSAAGTDFPNDVQLGLVAAVRNAAGSSPGSMTLKQWRAGQLLYPLN